MASVILIRDVISLLIAYSIGSMMGMAITIESYPDFILIVPVPVIIRTQPSRATRNRVRFRM